MFELPEREEMNLYDWYYVMVAFQDFLTFSTYNNSGKNIVTNLKNYIKYFFS